MAKPIQNKQPKQTINAPKGTNNEAKTAPNSSSKGLFTLKILGGFLFSIAFILYINTLHHGYALDDYNVIRDNSIVTKGISAIGEIFATPYRKGYFITTNDLYRPLSLAMFATEYELSDHGTTLSHFMNIFLFSISVVLLFTALHRLMEGKKMGVAFIAALLFAIHPIHTEVVANIKSRDEILCFLFAFATLNLFIKYLDTHKISSLVLALLCYFLSLLSKESAIMFIFIVPLVFYVYRNEDTKKSLQITLGTLAVAAVFLVIRYSVLSAHHANTDSFISFMDNELTNAPNKLSQLATAILATGMYIKLLFIPNPLLCDYAYNSIPFATFANIGVLLSLVAHIGLLVFAAYRLKNVKKDVLAFGILFYLITIALFSNVFFLIGAIFAERFAYFASAGFCLVIAYLLEQGSIKFFKSDESSGTAILENGKVLLVLVGITVVLGMLTVNRNKDWENNLTLFKADIPKAPNDSRLNYYIGTELVSNTATHEGNPVVKKQLIEEGIKYLRQSIAIYPKYQDAEAEIGNAFFQINANDSAEYHDLKALELKPNDPLATNNLAGVYFVTSQYYKAIDLCKNAIKVNPNYYNAYSNIGLCYYRMKKFDSALTNLYAARAISPSFNNACENLILVHTALGNADSVAKYKAVLEQIKADAPRP